MFRWTNWTTVLLPPSVSLPKAKSSTHVMICWCCRSWRRFASTRYAAEIHRILASEIEMRWDRRLLTKARLEGAAERFYVYDYMYCCDAQTFGSDRHTKRICLRNVGGILRVRQLPSPDLSALLYLVVGVQSMSSSLRSYSSVIVSTAKLLGCTRSKQCSRKPAHSCSLLVPAWNYILSL